MPLNIHPKCKARLKEELADQLETVSVNNKSYLDRQTTAGFFLASKPLPKHGPIIEQLESFIGEWPFYDFLYGFLSKRLHEESEYDSEVSTSKLTDIELFTDANTTADNLVETFDSLPWQYVFTLKYNLS